VKVRKSQAGARGNGVVGRTDGVEVRIEDTGPGIPLAECEEQIFNPFVTTKKDRCGLGAYRSCRRLLMDIDGFIRIEGIRQACGTPEGHPGTRVS
jgi:C4-dicarboxylate-specific signal transduction histidine kinase